MLGGDCGGRTVGASEDDGAVEVASGHVFQFGSGVDDVVDGLHGEVKGHELDNRSESVHGSSDTDASEA